MLAGIPLAFALDLDPGAVDQQVQRACRSAIGDVDLQALLAAAKGAEVRHRPVQVDQALDEPCRLPQRHAEQHLHRQAGLDRRITVVGLSAPFAGRRSLPGHGGIKPALRRLQAIAFRPTDRQRAAALERLVVGGPVPGLVGGGCGSAHALQLPHWIHEMKPSWDLCNRAARRCQGNGRILMPPARKAPTSRSAPGASSWLRHGGVRTSRAVGITCPRSHLA